MRGGQAWGWGRCRASALRDAWGARAMAMAVARPGPWGCFLFCEHVVFSIQNNKRGSSGFVCGGVTARPGPGPAGVPTWAALQPAFWSLGRSGGARGGAGPAQPPLSPSQTGQHSARCEKGN